MEVRLEWRRGNDGEKGYGGGGARMDAELWCMPTDNCDEKNIILTSGMISK